MAGISIQRMVIMLLLVNDAHNKWVTHPPIHPHTYTHTHTHIYFCSLLSFLMKWQVVIIKKVKTLIWRFIFNLYITYKRPFRMSRLRATTDRTVATFLSVYLSHPCYRTPLARHHSCLTRYCSKFTCIFVDFEEKRDASCVPVCLWLIDRPLTAKHTKL